MLMHLPAIAELQMWWKISESILISKDSKLKAFVSQYEYVLFYTFLMLFLFNCDE